MENKVEALNTCIVFFSSLGYETNIVFEPEIIERFYDGKYRFLVHNIWGNAVGFIDYNVYGLNFSLPFLKTGEFIVQEEIAGGINLDDPQVISFIKFKKQEKAEINGSFSVRYQYLDNGEKEYYVIIEGTYKDSVIEHQFSLGQQCSEITTIDRSHNDFDVFLGQLYLNPKGVKKGEAYIKYKYSGSIIQPLEVEDVVEASNTKKQNGGENLINDLHAREIVKTSRVYTSDIHEKQNQEKSIGQIVRLMKEINPQFQWQVNSLRAALGPWLEYLLDICFPNYTDEEIKTLFGIERNKVTFRNRNETISDINALYQKNNQRIRIKPE